MLMVQAHILCNHSVPLVLCEACHIARGGGGSMGPKRLKLWTERPLGKSMSCEDSALGHVPLILPSHVTDRDQRCSLHDPVGPSSIMLVADASGLFEAGVPGGRGGSGRAAERPRQLGWRARTGASTAGDRSERNPVGLSEQKQCFTGMTQPLFPTTIGLHAHGSYPELRRLSESAEAYYQT